MATALLNMLPFAKPTRRIRDRDYMARVRQLPCAMAAVGGCVGPIDADHASRNHGSARKGDDSCCVPLCHFHHMQRHNWAGPFKYFSGAQMRSWCMAQIAKTQATLSGSLE